MFIGRVLSEDGSRGIVALSNRLSTRFRYSLLNVRISIWVNSVIVS